MAAADQRKKKPPLVPPAQNHPFFTRITANTHRQTKCPARRVFFYLLTAPFPNKKKPNAKRYQSKLIEPLTFPIPRCTAFCSSALPLLSAAGGRGRRSTPHPPHFPSLSVSVFRLGLTQCLFPKNSPTAVQRTQHLEVLLVLKHATDIGAQFFFFFFLFFFFFVPPSSPAAPPSSPIPGAPGSPSPSSNSPAPAPARKPPSAPPSAGAWPGAAAAAAAFSAVVGAAADGVPDPPPAPPLTLLENLRKLGERYKDEEKQNIDRREEPDSIRNDDYYGGP